MRKIKEKEIVKEKTKNLVGLSEKLLCLSILYVLYSWIIVNARALKRIVKKRLSRFVKNKRKRKQKMTEKRREGRKCGGGVGADSRCGDEEWGLSVCGFGPFFIIVFVFVFVFCFFNLLLLAFWSYEKVCGKPHMVMV